MPPFKSHLTAPICRTENFVKLFKSYFCRIFLKHFKNDKSLKLKELEQLNLEARFATSEKP